MFVSESFARRHRVRENDAIELMTPDGPQSFPVAAILYDYVTEQGIVYMSAANFARFWHDDRIRSVAVYLKAGHRAEEVREALRARFSEGAFAIFSNESLRRRIFEIFDQTFAITFVLRSVAVVVAIAGVLLTMLTMVVERRRLGTNN